MLKDRGNIKWTAMMLPEHVTELRKFAEDLNKVPKPHLDEQQLEEFERTICEAMEYNQSITFTYWEKGEFKTIVGKVHYVVPNTKQLRIYDEFDERYYIDFEDLVDVRSYEL
ncbi:MAG: YolD-like family protein [Bacillaceae bacterium]|nr:YolD-like family protein [Bacillaceae bacterium]